MAKAKATDTEWQGDERRGNPRVRLQKVEGEIQGALEASVVDLSMSGALLEVPSAPPTSSRLVLKLPLDREGATPTPTLDIPGEVVRSYVHGFDKEGTAPPSVKYRAAMHFAELAPAERDGLEKFLEERGNDAFRAELSS